MKVKIVKKVKRSDGLWRFACGDVFFLYGNLCRKIAISTPLSEINAECHLWPKCSSHNQHGRELISWRISLALMEDKRIMNQDREREKETIYRTIRKAKFTSIIWICICAFLVFLFMIQSVTTRRLPSTHLRAHAFCFHIFFSMPFICTGILLEIN